MNGLLQVINGPTLDPNSSFSFKLSNVVNTMKGLTPFMILLCMLMHREHPYYALRNHTAWVYFGIHGSYGILWCMKTWTGFGDERWMVYKPLWYLPIALGALSLYWMPIYLICQQGETAPWMEGISVFLYAIGVFWHYCSDMQKTVFLEQKRSQDSQKISNLDRNNVLKDRLWSFSRNPNYFGELLIYSAFCVLAMRWEPFVWLATMVSVYWIPGMLAKDCSLSRFKDEFKHYQKETSFFIPYFF
mmetsp:Transcript_21859/g.65386  ORF Transcript_21859/g.65386 Transcript_21859/m.65386 type:complete len:245 (+) Transcript_21859:308-1042(+)